MTTTYIIRVRLWVAGVFSNDNVMMIFSVIDNIPFDHFLKMEHYN